MWKTTLQEKRREAAAVASSNTINNQNHKQQQLSQTKTKKKHNPTITTITGREGYDDTEEEPEDGVINDIEEQEMEEAMDPLLIDNDEPITNIHEEDKSKKAGLDWKVYTISSPTTTASSSSTSSSASAASSSSYGPTNIPPDSATSPFKLLKLFFCQSIICQS